MQYNWVLVISQGITQVLQNNEKLRGCNSCLLFSHYINGGKMHLHAYLKKVKRKRFFNDLHLSEFEDMKNSKFLFKVQ